jgi:hypothetical protein
MPVPRRCRRATRRMWSGGARKFQRKNRVKQWTTHAHFVSTQRRDRGGGNPGYRGAGVAVIIALLDAGRTWKAFSRMDYAITGSIDLAMKKARTAALFEATSEAVWEFCKPGGRTVGHMIARLSSRHSTRSTTASRAGGGDARGLQILSFLSPSTRPRRGAQPAPTRRTGVRETVRQPPQRGAS